MGQGRVPYRDIFDMNLPGVYLLHWARARRRRGRATSPGASSTSPGSPPPPPRSSRSACRWAGARAPPRPAVLFTLYHLAGGAWRAGQRDFLLCLFLAAGAVGHRARLGPAGRALAARPRRRRARPRASPSSPTRPGSSGWAALAAGALAARRAGRVGPGRRGRRAGGRRRRARSASSAGSPGAAASGAFVDEYVGYVLPFYGGLGRESLWRAIGGHTYAWALLALLAALVAWGLVRPAAAGLRHAPAARRCWVSWRARCTSRSRARAGSTTSTRSSFFLCALTAPALALRAPGADEAAAAAPRGWPPVAARARAGRRRHPVRRHRPRAGRARGSRRWTRRGSTTRPAASPRSRATSARASPPAPPCR